MTKFNNCWFVDFWYVHDDNLIRLKNLSFDIFVISDCHLFSRCLQTFASFKNSDINVFLLKWKQFFENLKIFQIRCKTKNFIEWKIRKKVDNKQLLLALISEFILLESNFSNNDWLLIKFCFFIFWLIYVVTLVDEKTKFVNCIQNVWFLSTMNRYFINSFVLMSSKQIWKFMLFLLFDIILFSLINFLCFRFSRI